MLILCINIVTYIRMHGMYVYMYVCNTLRLYNYSEDCTIWIEPSSDGSGSTGPSSVFSGVFIENKLME